MNVVSMWMAINTLAPVIGCFSSSKAEIGFAVSHLFWSVHMHHSEHSFSFCCFSTWVVLYWPNFCNYLYWHLINYFSYHYRNGKATWFCYNREHAHDRDLRIFIASTALPQQKLRLPMAFKCDTSWFIANVQSHQSHWCIVAQMQKDTLCIFVRGQSLWQTTVFDSLRMRTSW